MLQAVRAGATFGEARDRHLDEGELDERDRRLAYELAAGILRHQRELDGTLDLAHADPRLHDVLRLGAYQLHRLTRVPPHAAVSTTVELARETAGEGAARYVNQALRRLASDRQAGREHENGTGTHPDWLVKRWERRFGSEDTARLVRWNDTRPALVLQPIGWDAAKLREQLCAIGVTVQDAPFGAGLQVVPDAGTSRVPRPSSLPGFSEGAFVVQDSAQALVVRFAALAKGARVFDACAAPGGKAVLLARSGVVVVAGDAKRPRMARLTETTRRAANGRTIGVLAADLLDAPFAPGSWEAVLVDAPCTATGTMARHPDARWRLTAATIARAAKVQDRLLDAAAELVRPGGVLVYATCSLEPEENESQVNGFLQRHPGFARGPVAGSFPPELATPAGDLQSLPFRDGIDGAYAARLRREH